MGDREEEEYVLSIGLECPRPWSFLLRLLLPSTAIRRDKRRGREPIKSSPNVNSLALEYAWQSRLSLLFINILLSSGFTALLTISRITFELFPNILSLNGGFFNLLCKLLLFQKIEIPNKDSEHYLSMVGLIDPRMELMRNVGASTPTKHCADLCAMASKLAYENPTIIQSTIHNIWNMHFVNYYDCWNDRLQAKTTQAFMLVDKEHDANIILVSFRGTEVFEATDWASDLDFSWYKLPGLGRVHVGFLEALGLVNRNQLSTFRQLQHNCHAKRVSTTDNTCNTSGLDLVDDSKPLAFDEIRRDLQAMLKLHPHGSVYLTGHSLGGALAILFLAILMYCDDEEVACRIKCVWTFGQPRIGDAEVGRSMEKWLAQKQGTLCYLRTVFNNDVVPCVPPNDPLFQFKHFGLCHFFDYRYQEKVQHEDPNNNYFWPIRWISIRLNALREFLYNLLEWMTTPKTQLQQTYFSFILQFISLIVAPSIWDHSTLNYVNAVRVS